MAYVNAPYENKVIQDMLEEKLTTLLSMSQFLTVDTSLEGVDGMIKEVHRYKSTGGAEDVTEGSGNTNKLKIQYESTPYTCTTTQATFFYTDEQLAKDSYMVDAGITDLAKAIVNDYNAKSITELEKTTNLIYTGSDTTAPSFDNFADAIAMLGNGGLEDSEEIGFSALVNPSMKATLRKALKSDLQYVEAFVRAGYIGSICGIPIYTSKAVSKKEVIICSKAATTAFMKKEVETEQSRDIETRTNTVVARNVKVIALTDERYVAIIKQGAKPGV